MENKKLNVKMIYTVIGIASLTVAFVCVVVLAVKQYRLWKSGQMYEKLAESTTVPSTTMPLEGDMDEGTTQELEGYKREAARLITKYGIDVPEKNIDFDKLPTQFVLKCTHDSGGLVVCKDKSNLNKKAAKKKDHGLEV